MVDYLKANSQFLSHGYCPDCYAQALAEQTYGHNRADFQKFSAIPIAEKIAVVEREIANDVNRDFFRDMQIGG